MRISPGIVYEEHTDGLIGGAISDDNGRPRSLPWIKRRGATYKHRRLLLFSFQARGPRVSRGAVGVSRGAVCVSRGESAARRLLRGLARAEPEDGVNDNAYTSIHMNDNGGGKLKSHFLPAANGCQFHNEMVIWKTQGG